MDEDGLLACGEPGLQLTWMDAKVGDWVVTPRIGKPIEVQALWINALWFASQQDHAWQGHYERALHALRERYWYAEGGYLFDVIDVDHEPGKVDASLRPNQVFAVGGLPQTILQQDQAKAIVDVLETQLLTPLGLRSLASSDIQYIGRYSGGVAKRDRAYHQGTVWPWLMGPFVEAWVRVRGDSNGARREARNKFLPAFEAHFAEAGIGHISEIADADSPHHPQGCPFQAWSLGEYLRLKHCVLADKAPLKAAQAVSPQPVSSTS